jgi:hypothetical protein
VGVENVFSGAAVVQCQHSEILNLHELSSFCGLYGRFSGAICVASLKALTGDRPEQIAW